MGQPTTAEWAKSFGISPDSIPTVDGDGEPCPFTAQRIATRALILHGVVAVASDVDPNPVVDWFQNQSIWGQVSPKELKFLKDPESVGQDGKNSLRWRKEAEWALLWIVGKVEVLGLPTRQCDTRRLVDEIIPTLGSDIKSFLDSAELRSPGVLLAESNRHYNLWCRYFQTKRKDPNLLPYDLEVSVLYERQYVFEWLFNIEPWDDVQCDA